MRNHRLEAALRAKGITAAALATAVQVAPKTIGRWLADDTCVPRAEARRAVADHLGISADDLWSTGAAVHQTSDELLTVYPTRAAIPTALTTELIDSAHHQVDVVAISALSVWEGVDGLVDLLAAKAAAGVRVRIVLADPEGETLTNRGAEEGIGELVRARPQLAWAALRALRNVPGIELAMHDAPLPAAIIRADDDLLVNLHVIGLPDASTPVLHLRRQPGGRTAEGYLHSVDQVANQARPVLPAMPAHRVSRPRTLRSVAQSGA